MREAYHQLVHFRDDEDIRATDQGYAEQQRGQLRHLADVLRK
jgi:hypothetical protein